MIHRLMNHRYVVALLLVVASCAPVGSQASGSSPVSFDPPGSARLQCETEVTLESGGRDVIASDDLVWVLSAPSIDGATITVFDGRDRRFVPGWDSPSCYGFR